MREQFKRTIIKPGKETLNTHRADLFLLKPIIPPKEK